MKIKIKIKIRIKIITDPQHDAKIQSVVMNIFVGTYLH